MTRVTPLWAAFHYLPVTGEYGGTNDLPYAAGLARAPDARDRWAEPCVHARFRPASRHDVVGVSGRLPWVGRHPEDPIADREVRDGCVDSHHGPCNVPADRERRLTERREEPGSDGGVDGVDPASGDGDEHLAGRYLERDGLVTRAVTPSVPVRVDYALTDLGEGLRRVVQPLKQWAEDNMDTILDNRAAAEATCA